MATGVLGAYVVVATLNVASHLLGWPVLATVTKPLLMPLLLAVLVSSLGGLRGRLARAVAVGLVASWLGDLALMGEGEGWFLAGLGAFLGAQVAYSTGFWPFGRTGPLRRRPLLAVPYAAWWGTLLALLAADLDELLVPVAVYGAVLVTMAALATGVHRRTAVGAALFVASDSLIALTRLGSYAVPEPDALIMATYTLGQALLVLGVIDRVRADGVPTAPEVLRQQLPLEGPPR
jgi:uncharacterized membrane protein YhhN